MSKKAVFLHAGCPVYVDAEHQIALAQIRHSTAWKSFILATTKHVWPTLWRRA